MGCVFCATGQMGFGRNLDAGEIVEQVHYFARILKDTGEKVTNIVFMGMGEPFHNYTAMMKAIDILHDPKGLNLGERRFTISTVGLIPGIKKFTSEKRQINLAISLHAANDALRSSMLPINKKYPIADLIQACQEYVAVTSRRITFEYALIQDINDSNEHARELAASAARDALSCECDSAKSNSKICWKSNYAGSSTRISSDFEPVWHTLYNPAAQGD